MLRPIDTHQSPYGYWILTRIDNQLTKVLLVDGINGFRSHSSQTTKEEREQLKGKR